MRERLPRWVESTEGRWVSTVEERKGERISAAERKSELPQSPMAARGSTVGELGVVDGEIRLGIWIL